MAPAPLSVLPRPDVSARPATRAELPRWVALDRLRGAALLLMLFHHFTRWFTDGSRSVLPRVGSFALTDVAAPAFAIAAGASVVLFAQARRARSDTSSGELGAVLRRYGLLLPIGVALVWAVSGNPKEFGVLQMLGITTVVSYGAWRAAGVGGLGAVAAAGLMLGPLSEKFADTRLAEGTLAHQVLGDIFPLVTYLGFVALGAALAAGLRQPPAWRTAGLAVTAAGAVTVTLSVLGSSPQRYPGTYAFVAASLCGTAALYAALGAWHPQPDNRAAAVLGVATRHTFGVYIGHYAVRMALDAFHAPAVPLAAGLALAVAATAATTLVAPRVPTMPFSVRGVTRRPAPRPA